MAEPTSPSTPLHLVDTTMFWSPSSGGVRRYLLAKQSWLARRDDWRQTIVTPVAEGPCTRRIPALPLPGSGGYRLPIDRAACARALEQLQPDIIEAGDPYRLAWSTLDAARRLDIPAVAFCHSNLEAMASRATRPFGRYIAAKATAATRRYVRRLYDRYDLVLAPSDAMRQHLEAVGLRNVERQPLGVDSAGFNPSLRDAQWRRSLCLSLQLPAETTLLLYIGRFAPEKNLGVLTDAVRRLGPGYALIAVGAGPTPPAGERVRLRPYEADRHRLALLLANVDMLVHAGDQETFGLAVLEAMASGTAVVARAADGLAELVDERVGAGVDSLAPDAFAEAIMHVAESDASTRAARALAARERAVRYDWDRIFPSLFMRYACLIHGQARGTTIGLDSPGVLPASQSSHA